MSEKKIVLIFGMRGTGKTSLAKKLISNKKRLIVYDALDEYYEYGISCENLIEFKNYIKKLYNRNFRIIYNPTLPEKEFPFLCEVIFQLGDITFLIEEIDLYTSSNSIDISFANIIARGRHKNIELIGVSQRPFGIPRLLTSQAKCIYSFRMQEPRDIEYLKQIIGEEAEKVKDLNQFEYLKFEDGKINFEKL